MCYNDRDMVDDPEDELLYESEIAGSNKRSKIYFAKHQWVAIVVFAILVILGNVCFLILYGVMQHSLHREQIYITEWIVVGIVLLCLLYVITHYILNIPLTTIIKF